MGRVEMKKNSTGNITVTKKQYGSIWESLAVMILMLYPLRHIYVGLDLWDTGYNYANFQYMGLEHMDPMWLFSTYLANALGHFFTQLPGADTLAGMNLYTGLLVSAMALTGYLFCTRGLKWNKLLVFIGEMVAISLCWCPTALLYNYLTYVLFLAGVILLYLGLTKANNKLLFSAGVCLGTNVLVRFSNLPQAALIVAVWAYVIIQWLEERRGALFGSKKVQGKAVNSKSWNPWKRAVQSTLWCIGGYLSALVVLFGYIHLRYGITNYIAGIQRLFSMTDNATDYKTTSMLMGLIDCYVENLYWAIRIGCIAAVGVALMMVVHRCVKRNGQLRSWEKAAVLLTVVSAGGLYYRIFEDFLKSGYMGAVLLFVALALLVVILVAQIALFLHAQENAAAVMSGAGRLFGILLAVTMVCWLYFRGFSSSMEFWHYGAILRPGVLFLMLTMGIAVIRIFQPSCPREEKLISGMMILVILLTSLGSNNKVYPSLNNLFLAAPYALVECWKILSCGVGKLAEGRQSKEKKLKEKQSKGRYDALLYMFPVKCILAAFLGVFLLQSAGFGIQFVFAEATGVQDTSAVVENNEVLAGIKMSPDKAQWMTEISAYVKENELQGREVILYGYIPSLSYYLQMPSSFNPWSDLRSYHLEVMAENLQKLEEEITAHPEFRPVVLVDKRYGIFYEGGRKALEESGISEEEIISIEQDKKWAVLTDFLQNQSYELTFDNDKFALWE